MADESPEPSAPGAEGPAARTRTDDNLDASLRFLHVMGMQVRHELFDMSTRVLALIEQLIASGQVDPRALDVRREEVVARERERVKDQAHVQIGPDVDKYKLPATAEIDCDARIPLCHARCCTFAFPLSVQDINERVVEWEYFRPYQIRRKADGYCQHNQDGTRRCQIYAQRPAVCRSYDCRGDKRIWIDFDRRIPAPPPARGGHGGDGAGADPREPAPTPRAKPAGR
jgi:Fe-S-cluster containining protein